VNGEGAVSGKVVVFCFSSAGELDVVLPLLTLNRIDEFTIVAFRQEILEKLKRDTFYGALLEGRLESCAAPVAANKLLRWLRFIGTSLRIFWRFRHFDCYCFEYGGSGREKNVLLILLALTGRASKVRFYPHGHAVTAAEAYAPAKWPRTTAMCLRRGARILKLGDGASEGPILAVGYPILHAAWRALIAKQVPQLYGDHVVILSRDAHRDYLLAQNRLTMLADVVEVFSRCFPGSRIVMRAHPRELFESDRLEVGGRTVEITYENTYSVVRGARLAVSFWTSAFFQCMALDVPAVEYHVPHARFRELYPRGSLNAEFVPRFENREDLLAYCSALTARAPETAR
jgi:hypothetical protein